MMKDNTMIPLTMENCEAIYTIVSRRRFAKESLFEKRLDVLAPYRFVLQDSQRNIYIQCHDYAVYVGFICVKNGGLRFVDDRDIGQWFAI